MKEEQEKLMGRVRAWDGDCGGVDWTRLGELNHGGHMWWQWRERRGKRERERKKRF